MKKLFLVLIFLLVSVGIVSAADINFSWTQNTESDLAGYRIYNSLTSGLYSYGEENAVAIIPVGEGTVTVEDVTDGMKYWVITAYDTDGNESLPSNELSIMLDTSAPTAPQDFTVTVIVKFPQGE